VDADDLELLKAAAQGTAEGTVRGLLSPIVDFVGAVFGAPAREVGAYLADQMRFQRFKTQVTVFTKAKALVARAGVEPQSVPWKILVPLLEGAGNEDPEDATMAERWATMLANAAAGAAAAEEVLPSYPAILAQLSAHEVAILDYLYDPNPASRHAKMGAIGVEHEERGRVIQHTWHQDEIDAISRALGRDLAPAFWNLERLNLVTVRFSKPAHVGVYRTWFGQAFVKVTRDAPSAGS
jgi:hypothetical protein